MAAVAPAVDAGRLSARQELDIGSAVARIEQLHREGFDTLGGTIWERLISCDVPRLRAMLGPDLLATLDQIS